MSSSLDTIVAEVDPRMLQLLAVALVVLSLAASALYVIKPAWSEFADIQFRHNQAGAGMPGGAPSSESLMQTAEREVEDLRNALYGDAANIPRSEIESFVVDALDRVSEAHGVRLLSISPDLPDSILMFEELPYTVEVAGSFFAIHQWLYTVEQDLRPMVVKRFELTPSQDRTRVTLNMRIVAYRPERGETT